MMTKSTLLFLLIICTLSASPQSKLNRGDIADSVSTDSTVIAADDTTTALSDSLTALQSDSLLAAAKKDTLKPINYLGYSGQTNTGSSLTRSKIDRINYRFAGDIFNYVPFGLNTSLGSVGTPSEVYVNGLGFGNVSYLQNGVSITNRFQNALDLNLIQTELLDSLEILSLSSGFLYNNFNNPVSVNFITRTEVTPRPFSRIKFYQAPDNEGIFSGLFSAYLFKRVNFGFGMTNQSADPRYKNSDLSNWQFYANVRYMPSNKLNFLFNYDYSKINMGLNGGVDNTSTPDLIFDNSLADVNYLDRYHKSNKHNISLAALFEFDSTSYTNLSFYYQYNLDEFRQNEFTTDTTVQKIVNDNSYKSYGVNFYQKLDINPFRLDVIANYERTVFNVDYNKSIEGYNLWSLGGKLNATLLDGIFIPAVFVKTSGFDDDINFGFGSEVQFRVNHWLSASAGGSRFKRTVNPFVNSSETNDVTILETGLKTKFSFAKIDISYFNIEQTNYPLPLLDETSEYAPNSNILNYSFIDFKRSGVSLNLDIKLWKILLQSNTAFYFNEDNYSDRELPSQTSFGGIYYVDTLFNDNLDLKAGLNYKFYNGRGAPIYDFQKMQRTYYYTDYSVINPVNVSTLIQYNFQLDLFVAGTIRQNATVYIIFENLLDEQYYVVPYYPIQPRGLRLGVAWEFLD